MDSHWRLLKTGYLDGPTNMAIDESLWLGYVQAMSPPTLRLYGWRPAALSLGCFQNARAFLDLGKCAQEGVAVVRRMTGGGALLHHRELTYSIACSKKDLGMRDSIPLSFRKLCLFIIDAYEGLGLKPEFAVEADCTGLRQPLGVPRDLCGASKEKYDILINGKKIGGNAQKRHKDFIFQHGSIPLEKGGLSIKDFLAPGVLDCQRDDTIVLAQALGRQISCNELAAKLALSFETAFSLVLEEGELSAQERALVEELRKERYSQECWNLNRDYGYRTEKTALAQQEN